MLYLFYGADSFSRREALDRLKKELDADGMLGTNTVIFAARQTAPAEVVAACGAVPFLGSHRLVIVEGLFQPAPAAGRRPSGRRSPTRDASQGPWQALVDYVDQMPPTTTLVTVDGAVNEKDALFEALKVKGKTNRFPACDPRALPEWIQRRAKEIGLKIDARAVRLLGELLGGQRVAGGQSNDLWSVASELDKLAAYANGEVIREEDVRALTSAAREQKGYLLSDAVVEARPALALRLLQEILAQGDNPAALLGVIQSRYRRLAIAREMLDQGASDTAIGRTLGTQGYALERALEQASRYTMEQLRVVYRRLVEADCDVKRGVYDDRLSLEMLIADLAAVVPSRAA